MPNDPLHHQAPISLRRGEAQTPTQPTNQPSSQPASLAANVQPKRWWLSIAYVAAEAAAFKPANRSMRRCLCRDAVAVLFGAAAAAQFCCAALRLRTRTHTDTHTHTSKHVLTEYAPLDVAAQRRDLIYGNRAATATALAASM